MKVYHYFIVVKYQLTKFLFAVINNINKDQPGLVPETFLSEDSYPNH